MIDYEVCNEAQLRNINQVDPKRLSLDEDVFHIIGRPDQIWFNKSYCEILRYKTQALYDLIEKKGGTYVKSEDSNNITCVIYGAQPSVRAIDYFNGKVKLINAENAVMWLEKQKDYNPACRVFGKKYHSSEDTRLRPYQQLIKNRVFKIWDSQYNVMVQLPTGTGKTILFTSIINDLSKVRGSKIVILAHRKELIEQISEHLSHYNIEHGLITSGKARKLDLSVQVASIQTLTHEKNVGLLKELNPQFIIIDEAHHSLADTYTKFWKECGDCWKLGVTATPYRLNLHSFRSHFDKYVESDTIDDFIKSGYLADYDFYTDNPNSSLSRTIESIKEKSSTRDYNTAALLRALNVQKHIQRLIVCYEQYVKGKKGIVYAINKEHAHNICNAYQIIGVQAVYVDSDTPKLERQNIVEQFRKNEIQVMVNVDIFSEGFDCPDVEFIQLARPTWSLGKYLQQVGRGMRPSENKQKTVILDNARMFVKFGFPSDKRSWLSFFNGEYWLKDYQGKEDYDCIKYLQQADRGNNEMMIMPYRGNRRSDKSIIVQANKDKEDSELFRRIQIINYNARLKELKEKKAEAKRKEEAAKKEARRLEKRKYLLEHTPKEIIETPYFEKKLRDAARIMEQSRKKAKGGLNYYNDHGDAAVKLDNFAELVLPEGVTHIDHWAYSNSVIKKLVLPNSLRTLGMCAFKDCRELETVSLSPNTYCNYKLRLGPSDGIFAGCTKLTEIILRGPLREFTWHDAEKPEILHGFDRERTFLHCPSLSRLTAHELPLALIPEEWMQFALNGFLADPDRDLHYLPEIAEEYHDSLRAFRKQLIARGKRELSLPLVQYLTERELIREEETEPLLARAAEQKDPEITALLMDYQAQYCRNRSFAGALFDAIGDL